jgi:hypothetical protein
VTHLVGGSTSNDCEGAEEQRSWGTGETARHHGTLDECPTKASERIGGRHAGRVPHNEPLQSQWRLMGQPSGHAGRVPHKSTRQDQWRFVGQPSRLPSGGCLESAASAPPFCHPDRRPGGPQRRDLWCGYRRSVAGPSHRDPSARSLRSLGRDDRQGEARDAHWGRSTSTRWSIAPSRDPLEEHLCDSPRGVGLRKGSLSGAIDEPERPPVDGPVRWSAERCDCRPGARRRNPIFGTGGEQGDSRRDHAGVSSHGEKFVTDEADPNGLRDIPVEEVRADRLLDVAAQILPRLSLSDDRLSQTLGNVASVHFLGHLEYDFSSHAASLPSRRQSC